MPSTLPSKFHQLVLSYFQDLGWSIALDEDNTLQLRHPHGILTYEFETPHQLWRHWKRECIAIERWKYLFACVDTYAAQSSKNKRWVEAWLLDSRKSKFNAEFNRMMQDAHVFRPSELLAPGWLKSPTWATNIDWFDRSRWVDNLRVYLLERERERLNTSIPSSIHLPKPPRL